MSSIRSVTVRAPVNIAVIKYWGKCDEQLIIPINDSLSGTLSVDNLCATTTAAVSERFTEDRMWLNGKEEIIANNKRLVNCIDQIRSRSSCEWKDQRIHICSRNNFPTAAGLASSAAGYACFVYALGKLFEIHSTEELSRLARMGSGSACRSVYGGFVEWIRGYDSETSIAKQVVDENHWPQMRVLVLVVSDHQKDTSSTSGMQQSVKTSALLKYRAENIVDNRMQQIKAAIIDKDFNKFAELTMRDSNQFHAIAQDTYPPIRYMNDISWSIVRLCHKYNEFYGTNKIAYTFDAGPNACLYLLEQSVPEVYSLFKQFYPPNDEREEYLKGIPIEIKNPVPEPLITLISKTQSAQTGAIRYVISTKIGTGPQILDNTQSLIDSNGNPKY